MTGNTNRKPPPEADVTPPDDGGAAEQEQATPGGFTETAWHGRPLYQCAACAFDTFDREAMLQHQRALHGLAKAAPPPAEPAARFDRYGNPVEEG